MSDGKKLESLAEANARRVRAWVAAGDRRFNGIACPGCGSELVDAGDNVVLTSMPPQVSVFCPCCNWKGTRVQ